MLKLSDNPPQLSPPATTVAELTGQWWIAHTKSRAEKAFARDLASLGIGYYLPLVRRTAIISGKKRQVLKPLFGSYVFLCGNEQARYKALTTDRLCQVIPVVEQEKLVAELSMIQRALAGSPELDLYPHAAIGNRCRITAGPFQGMEGIVVRRTNRATLVMEVSILKQGASVEIDLDLIEPVGE